MKIQSFKKHISSLNEQETVLFNHLDQLKNQMIEVESRLKNIEEFRHFTKLIYDEIFKAMLVNSSIVCFSYDITGKSTDVLTDDEYAVLQKVYRNIEQCLNQLEIKNYKIYSYPNLDIDPLYRSVVNTIKTKEMVDTIICFQI